jgi:outer membrane protein OmpA-like peptidoglycan-associated protein
MIKKLSIVGMAALIAVVSSGCVSKKLFRKNMESTDTRVIGVESGIEENERRIEDLSTETDGRIKAVNERAEEAVEIGNSAMSAAEAASQAAERAARGKLLWEVTLSDDRVRFGFNESGLSEEANAALADIANRVKAEGKAVYLEIEGHTDSTGAEAYNMELGERRAGAVMRYLNREGGIPLHAMNVISYGSSQPVADNGGRDGRAQNRRVVIKVLE